MTGSLMPNIIAGRGRQPASKLSFPFLTIPTSNLSTLFPNPYPTPSAATCIPSYASRHAPRQVAVGLFVAQAVGDVREERPPGADMRGGLDGLTECEMHRVHTVLQRVQDQHVQTLEHLERRLGYPAHVRAISQSPDAEAQALVLAP